ncbi:hypothetical protein D3C75_913370 [compost metagenome]
MNWDWLYTFYSISVAFLVITLVWKIVEKLFMVIALIFNNFITGAFVMIYSAIPYYFNAAFSALTVYYVGDGNPPVYLIILTAIFLVFNNLMTTVKLEREAKSNYDFQSLRMIRYRYVLMSFELLVFIVSMYNINLSINQITLWLADLMNWIQSIPYVNIVVDILAFLNAAYIVLTGVFTIFSLLLSFTIKQDKLEM